jgi:predicted acetyltransferase
MFNGLSKLERAQEPMTDFQAERVRVERASVSQKPALRDLLTAYLAEFAAREGRVPERDQAGHVPYRFFEGYWSAPERIPFTIMLGEELIGFCFLRDVGDAWSIAEFYVVPGRRRQGVGRAAVVAIKDYCQRTGTHSLLIAKTLRSNEPARAFWLRQGFRTIAENEEIFTNVADLGPTAEREST